MQPDLSSKEFCTYLLTQFPFAVDDEKEMMLSDYVTEQLNMPSNKQIEALTGKTDESGQETASWNGYTYVHPINAEVTFYAEFHPYNTIYFFNDTYLGNTGGHFHLSLLSWTELRQIVANDKHERSPLFLLLLPLTIGKESEKKDIADTIAEELQQTALQLTKEQLEEVTKFIGRHLVFKDQGEHVLTYKEHIGLVTSRNHSERNHQHKTEELVSINEIIKLATR